MVSSRVGQEFSVTVSFIMYRLLPVLIISSNKSILHFIAIAQLQENTEGKKKIRFPSCKMNFQRNKERKTNKPKKQTKK